MDGMTWLPSRPATVRDTTAEDRAAVRTSLLITLIFAVVGLGATSVVHSLAPAALESAAFWSGDMLGP